MARHVLIAVFTMAVSACSPPGAVDASSNSAVADPETSVRKSATPPVVPETPAPTVILTRNLKRHQAESGKPLPKKPIVLKRTQRIDIVGEKGVSSFVGPGTITADGEFISGGGGGEGKMGFGPGKPILQIGGTRLDAAKAPAPRPLPPVAPRPAAMDPD